MSISEKEKALRTEWLVEYFKVREIVDSCYTFGHLLPVSWEVFIKSWPLFDIDRPLPVVLPFGFSPFDIIESHDDFPEVYHEVETNGDIRDFIGHNSYMINHPETAKNLGPFWNNLNIKYVDGANILTQEHLIEAYGITLRQAEILAEVDGL